MMAARRRVSVLLAWGLSWAAGGASWSAESAGETASIAWRAQGYQWHGETIAVPDYCWDYIENRDNVYLFSAHYGGPTTTLVLRPKWEKMTFDQQAALLHGASGNEGACGEAKAALRKFENSEDLFKKTILPQVRNGSRSVDAAVNFLETARRDMLGPKGLGPSYAEPFQEAEQELLGERARQEGRKVNENLAELRGRVLGPDVERRIGLVFDGRAGTAPAYPEGEGVPVRQYIGSRSASVDRIYGDGMTGLSSRLRSSSQAPPSPASAPKALRPTGPELPDYERSVNRLINAGLTPHDALDRVIIARGTDFIPGPTEGHGDRDLELRHQQDALRKIGAILGADPSPVELRNMDHYLHAYQEVTTYTELVPVKPLRDPFAQQMIFTGKAEFYSVAKWAAQARPRDIGRWIAKVTGHDFTAPECSRASLQEYESAFRGARQARRDMDASGGMASPMLLNPLFLWFR